MEGSRSDRTSNFDPTLNGNGPTIDYAVRREAEELTGARLAPGKSSCRLSTRSTVVAVPTVTTL